MLRTLIFLFVFFIQPLQVLAQTFEQTVFEAGHKSLAVWVLPDFYQDANNNQLMRDRVSEKVKLGKVLFFDPRLSKNKNMSCATCHNPLLGWADGVPKAIGHNGKVLSRATPTIVNSGFNDIQMWDGRDATLEDQAIGPMLSADEMHADLGSFLHFVKNNDTYSALFKQAFPDQDIKISSVTGALAIFQRTVISNNSPFDKWVKGDNNAMTKDQINGFKLFMNPKKGNCSVCHSAPNFTDNGFHNLGLASFGKKDPDLGRYHQRPLKLMRGAFKTPTLRDISLTAPYFHDGSARTLEEVMEHYKSGGIVKTNISPNFIASSLSVNETADVIAFMKALTTDHNNFTLPKIPQ